MLPASLQDALLAILFGDPQRIEADLAALLERAGPDRAAVASHLAAHQRMQPAAGAANVTIPGYRIDRCIGEGGMGVVYAAEQLVPLHRRVAVKVIRTEIDSRAVAARFERERQALAVMDHDAIAKVFDCGTTAQGQPFFAMELVPGQPLDRYCDARQLPVADRLRLFLQVCRGVQHAHQKGVIHRDLKPGNVLVIDQDGEGRAKIIDFGIARAVARESRDGDRTEVGVLLGTPEYMSPEQARGDGAAIDTRTDVWSLGAMLYELICGTLPFADPSMARNDLRAHRLQAAALDLQRPSTAVSRLGPNAGTIAARRRRSVTALQRELRGDLDWIVLRAMANDPEQRYPSAVALADDLQRHLDGLPTLAGPPTRWYRLRKFVRRYRLQLSALAAVAIAVLTGWHRTASALADLQRSQRRFDLLANVELLRDARRRAEQIYPADSAHLATLRTWRLEHASPLLAARPIVQAAMAELPDDADLAPGTRAFLCESLQRHLDELTTFEATTVAEVVQAERWAERIAAATASHPRAPATWEAAKAAILAADGITASRLYAAMPLDLAPQEGLVPLGLNPATGLWEFYDLRSAWDAASGLDPIDLPLPRRRDDGTFAVDETTGIVFVLLPGGATWFGAQGKDPATPHFVAECPPGVDIHRVVLAPFFLARHELTQGQWQRLAGRPWPCFYALGTQVEPRATKVARTHPVENVPWTECNALLRRHGMVLPTEAQWEHGCRAGSSFSWSWGDAVADLAGRVNLLDAHAKEVVAAGGYNWPADPFDDDDGFVIHAPIGSFPANAFGLHDMHGNVREWCLDGSVSPDRHFAPGDGAQTTTGSAPWRGIRGGSFTSTAREATSWWPAKDQTDAPSHERGCRAARAIAGR
jgi:serine/threonine protein kinase/formylglycine-generating enzyme required for sulfatase activity